MTLNLLRHKSCCSHSVPAWAASPSRLGLSFYSFMSTRNNNDFDILLQINCSPLKALHLPKSEYCVVMRFSVSPALMELSQLSNHKIIELHLLDRTLFLFEIHTCSQAHRAAASADM